MSQLPDPAKAEPAAPSASAISLSPYDANRYTDLYAQPNGPITGSTYIFNPTANRQAQMAYDFQRMRALGINTVGFYNLVQMTDADRDALFTSLEANRQKAVVRIEWYDAATFNFDNNDAGYADVNAVLRHYNTDDRVHGYTALLSYLVRKNRLRNIAYFAVNMPVDDGAVANHFVTAQYPDGRSNPRWAASQAPYLDRLNAGLRGVLGGPSAARLYASIFYGWDQSYPTPSYAGIAHPADGYFFNNYSYPIGAPPDRNASTSVRLNQPRLQSGMDRLVAQYPTQPKVVEYGFHTVEYNRGRVPNQTAGVVADIATKTLALKETTAYYATGSSRGTPFNVRGTLYFAQNLYKEEGNPPAVMDWTLDYPVSAQAEAEDTAVTRSYRDDTVVPTVAVRAPGASGGRAATLPTSRSAIEFYNLAASSAVRLRYRTDRTTVLRLSVNGAAPRTVRVPASRDWATVTVNLDVPLQGAVRVRHDGSGARFLLDWMRPAEHYEAEFSGGPGTSVRRATDTSQGAALTMPAGRTTALTMDGVRGGTALTVRYAAASPTRLGVVLGRSLTTVDLPATGGPSTFASRTIPLTTRGDERLTLIHAAGTPAVTVDYARLDGQYEAEGTGGLYNGVHGVARAEASAGSLTTGFDVVGASVVFTQVRAGSGLTFRYASTGDSSMTLIGIGPSRRIDFPDTGGRLALLTVPIAVPDHGTVIVQRNADNAALGLSIDWLAVAG